MNALIVFLAVIFVAGLAAGAYAIFAPKKIPAPVPVPVPAAAPEAAIAAPQAEFDSLGDSARCDFIFGIGVLEDERTRSLLFHALDDRSEAVALAAAHVLARSGSIDEVRRHVATQDPSRRDALMQLLSVMT